MEVTNINSFAIEIPDMAIHIETPISDFDRLITLIRRFIQRDRMLCKKQNFEPLKKEGIESFIQNANINIINKNEIISNIGELQKKIRGSNEN